MPFHYSVNTEKNLLIKVFSGVIRLNDVIESIKQVYADPVYSPAWDHIADLLEAQLEFTYHEMLQFVYFLNNNPCRSQGRCALLVNSPANYGQSRMFSTLGESFPDQIRLFSNRQEALDWLEWQKNQNLPSH